jgi:hypothetical protein
MIKRLVTDSDETLNAVVGNIKAFFTKTDSKGKPYKYTTKITTEKRKFADPVTKEITEKSVEVLDITDTENKDNTKVKMIPLIKAGEMRFEIGGDNESTIAAKIKDAIAGKGQWKDYNKNTLKTKLGENGAIKLMDIYKEGLQDSMFKIDPSLAFQIYKVLINHYPEIGNDYSESTFFNLLNKEL